MEIGQKVKIISDSTCDLSQELTAKYSAAAYPAGRKRVPGRQRYHTRSHFCVGGCKQGNAENLCAVSGGCQSAAAAVC